MTRRLVDDDVQLGRGEPGPLDLLAFDSKAPCGNASLPTSACSASKGKPASSRAPRIMSPLAPEKQSK